ncbi:Protein kinase superfamily protein [Zea mays]|uniref:Protein kinase superfamily protein n=3 Tax=Zea mays TaxID=4577 RepID=K7VXE1_MAIZE|nr:Protein kinase superfamily protein [Zea mays]
MGSSLSSCCGSEKVEQGCVSASTTMSSTWRIFSYKELHAATNGFSEENKLGEGGFGSVYWGKTSDGLQIAVKKLKATNNSKAEMEFAVEVEVLARVRHKNLLGLRGYCAGADQRMIVYDYMPNLSLLSHLHGQFAGEVRLDWKRRVAVAVGSAEGLVYLHHEVAPHIIHRDIKASNVLLDSDFAPLVADFGFAKLVPEGVSHMTTRVKGTLGYLAPEYAMWGKVSGACDVYSFGILLLELVSGRKPIERLPSGAKRTITEWAEPLIARGRLGDLVDPRLRGAFDAAQLARAVECAALCVQGEPDRRPDMKTVVRILRGDNNAGAPAAAMVGRGGSKGDLQQLPVRMESVKYADRLMEMDKSTSYYGEPEDGDEDEQEEEDDDDEVEEYSLIDDKSSMNFGAFGAMPVQTMQDPYVKRFSGNANAIKI